MNRNVLNHIYCGQKITCKFALARWPLSPGLEPQFFKYFIEVYYLLDQLASILFVHYKTMGTDVTPFIVNEIKDSQLNLK